MVTYLGSLVQLWGSRDNAKKYHWLCGECSQCIDHTGFATAQGSVCFPAYTAQAPGCSARALSEAGPAFRALPRSKPLRCSGTPQGHRLGPRWAVCLNHLPGPSCLVSRVRCESTISSVRYVSSGGSSQAPALLADVNRPGSQEDAVSNREPAPIWQRMPVSGAEIGAGPRLLALAVRLPL